MDRAARKRGNYHEWSLQLYACTPDRSDAKRSIKKVKTMTRCISSGCDSPTELDSLYCICCATGGRAAAFDRAAENVLRDIDELRKRTAGRLEAIGSPSQRLPQQSAPELESNIRAINRLRVYLEKRDPVIKFHYFSQPVDIAIAIMREQDAALKTVREIALMVGDFK